MAVPYGKLVKTAQEVRRSFWQPKKQQIRQNSFKELD
jgi:hypothetical protein